MNADAPAMRITVDDAKLLAMLARAPMAIQQRVGQLVEGAAIDIQAEMRIAAPVAVTGDLRRSIRYTYTPSLLRAEVGPTVPYAADVEQGTRPHYVSVQPGSSLWRWAQLKGINPYALRNSIARKGTRPHPYVQPTYLRMKDKVQGDIAAGIAALAGGLNDGSV